MKKLLAIVLLVGACKSPQRAPEYDRELPPGTMALELVNDPSQYPDFGPGLRQRESLLRAIDQSLSWYSRPSSQRRYPYLEISHERAIASLQRLRELIETTQSERDFHASIAREFDVYRSRGWNGRGVVFFTGYYQPIFEGSLERTDEFCHPLYRLPADLVKDPDGTPRGRRMDTGGTVPYYTREEIERGNLLAGQEIVWLNNRFDAYIVHVQGSARIRLRDGSIYEIGYAGKTDRPYHGVGTSLVEDGRIERSELSLERLRRYFREHPADLDRYLYRNESFVFFTERTGGPYGSLNVPVTPMTSIATDKAVFPAGAAAFLVTDLGGRSHAGFAMDQDTGGAIRSAGRCDVFIGTGDAAGLLAGRVGAEGRLFYVFLKWPPRS